MNVSIDNVFVSYQVDGPEVLQVDYVVDGPVADSRAGVLEIRVLDRDGRRLELANWTGRSKRFGEYKYIEAYAANEPRNHQTFRLRTPPGAHIVQLIGHKWLKYQGLSLATQPVVSSRKHHHLGEEIVPGLQVGMYADFVDSSFKVEEGSDHVKFDFEIRAASTKNENQVVTVEFFDENERQILPPEELSLNEDLGAYIKLTSKSVNYTHTTPAIRIPGEAVSVRLRGTSFAMNSSVLSSLPTSKWLELDGKTSLEEFLAGTDVDDTLVIFDTTGPAMGDPARALRPNNIAFELANRGVKVILFPFTVLGGLPFRPHENIFQTDRKNFLSTLQRVGEDRKGAETIYVCTSFSDNESIAANTLADRYGWIKIYEARDDMEEFRRAGYSKWFHVSFERWIMQHSDRISAVSETLAKKLRSLAPSSDFKVNVSPNAAPEKTIIEGEPYRNAASWNGRPMVVGYVGHFTPSWFDWERTIGVALRLPDVKFELIGHGLPKGLRLPDNIECFGPKSHEEILEHARLWRVGLIPFRPSPLSLSVDPNKLFEYAAWGLRTVSAPMGSVETAPSTWVYGSEEEMLRAVQQAVSDPMTEIEMQELDDFARENSWKQRAGEFLTWMVEA